MYKAIPAEDAAPPARVRVRGGDALVMDDHGLRLSVVATSRNDDHGANLRRRMQTFVNAFIGQCRRHELRAELILVEWNPPADRPRLAQALQWPADPSPCEVRIIEVPEALHRRFRHSEALPLFQMIAKNVGIRRARGQFILATNIDILFNDELMRFLKDGDLQTGKIYRIDRTDVETDVPVDASVEEQLGYCADHLLRFNTAYGTFPARAEADVIAEQAGIALLRGVWPAERDAMGQVMRWGQEDICVGVTAPAGHPRRLLVELAPGPSIRSLPATIEVRQDQQIVARGRIADRSVVALTLPVDPGEHQVFQIRAVEGGYYRAPTPEDNRLLDLAFYRLTWSEEGPCGPPATPEDAFRILPRDILTRDPHADIMAADSGIGLDQGWQPLQQWAGLRYRRADAGARLAVEPGSGSARILDLWVAASGELRDRRDAEVQVLDDQGRVLATAPLTAWPRLLNVPIQSGLGRRGSVTLDVRVGGAALAGTSGARVLCVFSCAWSESAVGQRLAAAIRARLFGLRLWGGHLLRTLGLRSQPRPAVVPAPPRTGPMERTDLGPEPLPLLHTNTCGDFTLMAKEDWIDLKAYVELELYSFHIDSVLLYAAHFAGLEELVLPGYMQAFHIEHSAGSGWTPEGHKHLFERLRSRGIPSMADEDLYSVARCMRLVGNPCLFSADDWGLPHETLPETRIGTSPGAVAA